MSVTVAEKSKVSLLAPPQKNGGKEIYYPESDGKSVAETKIHVDTIFNLYGVLANHFSAQKDVAVIADMMFYYEKGNPRKSTAPDVMVVKGVHNNPRRVFKLWEEASPAVIFEISSRGTWRDDIQKKYFLYQEFGVEEYYIFDPEYDYLSDGLVSYHLTDGEFNDVKINEGRVFSPALGLEIVDTRETLRLFNPETKKFLPTMNELGRKADQVEVLESEIEKLKAEIAKLNGEISI